MKRPIPSIEESAIAAGLFSVLSSAADVLALNACGNCAANSYIYLKLGFPAKRVSLVCLRG